MNKAIFKIDGDTYEFSDITKEHLNEFMGIVNEFEQDLDEEDLNEDFTEMCKELNINSIAAENALVSSFRKAFGKEKAEIYLSHIL